MQIQINTDNNINADKDMEAYYASLIEKALGRFEDHITRIEVHLSDENSEKFGTDDKRCLIEARLNGKQPVAVTNSDETLEKSFRGSLDKIKKVLDTTLDKMRKH
tara:strand:- start:165364 stop:165678 length:315 start_codon:yes stop_codon:yes gene_type:complete